MSFVIPIKRLQGIDTLLAFYHPKLAYPFHIVLTPKPSLSSLTVPDPARTEFLSDLETAIQPHVAGFQLPFYRLVVNGGDV